MSKSKKHKKPNIPVSALARPRLDAILAKTGHEPEATVTLIAILVRELGTAPVLDSFVKCVQFASPEEQERLRGLATLLRADENKTHLWNLVKRQGGMSDDAKRAALIVLQAMGEDIALDDTARYLPPPRPKSTSKPNQSPLRLEDTLLIYALTRLQATETLPLIEKAFDENRVDESLHGDWEDLQIELGLKTTRANPRRKTFLDNIRLP